MRAYVRHRMSTRDVLRLPCPKCPVPLASTAVKHVLSFSKESAPATTAMHSNQDASINNDLSDESSTSSTSSNAWLEYEAMVLEASLRHDPSVRWCPNPRCGLPITQAIPDDDDDNDEEEEVEENEENKDFKSSNKNNSSSASSAHPSQRRRSRRYLRSRLAYSRALALSCAALLGGLGPVVWHWRAVT